ncbi:hypothetical protein PoB_000044400 [Plakobranchus ocellatus]|uniref:Uncharacterized protein n=1 Tax=Plakobranchus ocellatus TaxID=259542 RepID=A0AAV3XVH5_9GAST|nr:hypothetical protein PoB_000044400 [Plakobranchus ocellatus]
MGLTPLSKMAAVGRERRFHKPCENGGVKGECLLWFFGPNMVPIIFASIHTHRILETEGNHTAILSGSTGNRKQSGRATRGEQSQ